ncbi:MAG: hypothetical protein JW881_07555 [Spirochaetales bacterium]|nr:hypothetical protein [Spirochaetales bacterium]
MDDHLESELENILKQIEFPGESWNEIMKQIRGRNLENKIMKKIHGRNERAWRVYFWIVFTILNFLILSVMGTNKYIITDYFSLNNDLAALFFLFLGISLLGGLIGLIANANTPWFDKFRHGVLGERDKETGRYGKGLREKRETGWFEDDQTIRKHFS